VLIDHGKVLAVYRKTHLWDREKLIFEAGSEPAPVIATSAGRIALMVCYDLEVPEMVRDVAQRGAQLIAVPANWPAGPKPPGERPIDVVKAQAGAAMNRVFIAVADRCGVERGVDWFGGSVICDVTGYPHLLGPRTASQGLCWLPSTSPEPTTSGWVRTTTPCWTGDSTWPGRRNRRRTCSTTARARTDPASDPAAVL
jgi:5-aminopentanamidase